MLHYVAIRSSTNDDFPPHCGLMVENDLYLKKSGSSAKYRYMLAHALLQGDSSTKFDLIFCNSRYAIYKNLQSVHDAYKTFFESECGGITTYMSCQDLVSCVTTELNKPFDPQWKEHLRGAEKAGERVTNCALFTARIYYALAHESEKTRAVQNLKGVFSRLNLERVATKYLKDFN